MLPGNMDLPQCVNPNNQQLQEKTRISKYMSPLSLIKLHLVAATHADSTNMFFSWIADMAQEQLLKRIQAGINNSAGTAIVICENIRFVNSHAKICM